MSREYFDLVLVRFVHGQKNQTLAVAPSWSSLNPGDSVTVRIGEHRPRAIVVDCLTTNEKHDEYRFNLRACCCKEPLPRIDSKVVYKPFEYEDEVEDKEDGETDG